MIHKTAIISEDARLHETVEVGPYAIIEGNVEIDEGCSIGPHVQIAPGARLGKNVQVFQGAVVGSIPQDLKFEGEESLAIIGDGTRIREYATVNRGTSESGSTDVGENCLLMAYAHVAHDCKLGDNVIMANSVNLGGHVYIGDYAIVGGVVPVHQFVKIGTHSMVGGGFRVVQDLCPYSMAGGYPLKIAGLNIIGLRRRDFPRESIKILREVFKILFFSNLNTSQAVEKIKNEIELIDEVNEIFQFIKASTRGLVKA
ncbi:MAG: acyl-ACP--UDP-N-acetylglucosamine O-acyltransferase [candidate division Zixibacteria bacterium]